MKARTVLYEVEAYLACGWECYMTTNSFSGAVDYANFLRAKKNYKTRIVEAVTTRRLVTR